MKLQLTVTVNGARQSRTLETDDAVTIGSGEGATVSLTRDDIFEYHVILEPKGSHAELTALGPNVAVDLGMGPSVVEINLACRVPNNGIIKIGPVVIAYTWSASSSSSSPDSAPPRALPQTPFSYSPLPEFYPDDAPKARAAAFFSRPAASSTAYEEKSSDNIEMEEEKESFEKTHAADDVERLPYRKVAKVPMIAFLEAKERFHGAQGDDTSSTAMPARCWESEFDLGYDDVETDAVPLGDHAIARINIDYRYIDNAGQGALKYGPVDCSRILDHDACKLIRKNRGHGNIEFFFQKRIDAHVRADYVHKVMVVPSVSCPEALEDISFCNELLWSKNTSERPTFLVVHQHEVETYVERVGKILEKLGVGLVSWVTSNEIYGFGVSRLAAQAAGQHFGQRGTVVICDVNVLYDDDLIAGYATDDDEDSPPSATTIRAGEADLKYPNVLSSAIYVSPGMGTGVPLQEWVTDEETGNRELMPTGASPGQPGRPIEQVVIVGDELLFDPCFITSSEDFDMSQAFLLDQNSLRPASDGMKKTKNELMSYADYKLSNRIEKVSFEGAQHSGEYFSKRNEYLARLDYENSFKVIIPKEKEHRANPRAKKLSEADYECITIGEVVERIIKKLETEPESKAPRIFTDAAKNKFRLETRSLIIEKILLVANSHGRRENLEALAELPELLEPRWTRLKELRESLKVVRADLENLTEAIKNKEREAEIQANAMELDGASTRQSQGQDPGRLNKLKQKLRARSGEYNELRGERAAILSELNDLKKRVRKRNWSP